MHEKALPPEGRTEQRLLRVRQDYILTLGTHMAVFTVDPKDAKAFIQEKARLRAETLQKKLLQARADFEAIKNLLVQQCSPKRIYQWGSLIHAEHFSEISDIDVAVEGLTDPIEISKALNAISEMSDFPIDLVRLETLRPEDRQYLTSRARLVYERP
jgi:predicted nucleotidyltransferase